MEHAHFRLSFLYLSLSAVCLLALSPSLYAQTRDPIEFVTTVPESPAFAFLSASPSEVQQPGTLRDLGASILSGIGADGRAQQGFALDASVWNLFPSLSIPLDKYQNDRFSYALANTQLSIATVRAASDTSDTEAALGIRITLWDRSDPMRDRLFTQGLGNALLQECAPSQPGAGRSAACVDSVTVAHFEEWAKENEDKWNDASLFVAGAGGLRFDSSRVGETSYSGFDVWGVGAYPLANIGQLVGQIRYKDRPELGDEPANSAWSLGLRLNLGKYGFTGFGEYILESINVSGDDPESEALDGRTNFWSAGIEYLVADNIWISTGIGDRYRALGEPERLVVFGSIKWGISSQSRFESLRPN